MNKTSKTHVLRGGTVVIMIRVLDSLKIIHRLQHQLRDGTVDGTFLFTKWHLPRVCLTGPSTGHQNDFFLVFFDVSKIYRGRL